MRSKRTVVGILAAVIIVCLGFAQARAASITLAYHSASDIPAGSIVSLINNKAGYAELADTTNGTRLLGVAVASHDSLLAINPTSGNVEVATSGTAPTLVSNLDGDIRAGDKISVSPISGVGMKAELGLPVIGLAESTFNDQTANTITQKITDKSGKQRSVRMGYIRTTLSVDANTGSGNNSQPDSLQRIVQNITGRVIPTSHIVMALVVALITILSLSALIYASIYGSIISIGRNPLAKYTVMRTLRSVLGLASITAFIAVVIIFMLLR